MFLQRAAYYSLSGLTLARALLDKHNLWRFASAHHRHQGLELELRDPNLRFKVRDLLDIWIVKEVCLDRSYYPPSMESDTDWTLIDIGGGFGAFAVDAAYRHTNGKVYSYEPFQPSFELLRENLRLNSISNVRAFPYAVGGTPGTSRLYLDQRSPLLHSTVPPDPRVGLWPSIEVETTSLDAIMNDTGIDHCDVLKIDCEGGEYELLFGASGSTFERIRFVTLEYHDNLTGYQHEELVRFLTLRGFDVTLVPSPAHPWLGQIFASNTAFGGSASQDGSHSTTTPTSKKVLTPKAA